MNGRGQSGRSRGDTDVDIDIDVDVDVDVDADGARSAYDCALGLLTRREHSRLELVHKLALRGYGAAVSDAVLQRLADEGWQSDRRFAEIYAQSRADKGYGPLRIRAELRGRGVDDDIVAEQLAGLDDFWPDSLRRLAHRRFGLEGASGETPDAHERARQTRFLRQRGFTLEQISALYRRR